MMNKTRVVVYALIIILLLIVINTLLMRGSAWKIYQLGSKQDFRRQPTKTITPAEAHAYLGKRSALFIDIRSKEEHEKHRIPGAISVPYRDFIRHPFQMNRRKRNTVIIVYDNDAENNRIEIISGLLHRSDFRNVCFLQGGFAAWERGRLPVEPE